MASRGNDPISSYIPFSGFTRLIPSPPCGGDGFLLAAVGPEGNTEEPSPGLACSRSICLSVGGSPSISLLPGAGWWSPSDTSLQLLAGGARKCFL